jgi:hypothetical protein
VSIAVPHAEPAAGTPRANANANVDAGCRASRKTPSVKILAAVPLTV